MYLMNEEEAVGQVYIYLYICIYMYVYICIYINTTQSLESIMYVDINIYIYECI
jgi:hypothetical protein